MFIALGSNLGEREAMFVAAVEAIGRLPSTRVLQVAPTLETDALLPPDDPTPQPRYLNTVVELSTELAPMVLLKRLKALERELGRKVTTRWAPREIDLDLVLYGTRVIEGSELIVPHPGLVSRRFVLEPLLALDPELADPRTGRSLRACLMEI